jgi:hypothetical protein
MTNHYIIYNGDTFLKLKKGMTITEVTNILGQPNQIDKCANPHNVKYNYRLKGASALNSYLILFNADMIVYVAKTNY